MGHITPARRVIADIARSIGLHDEVASRLALAAHELLENAVKYTLDQQRRCCYAAVDHHGPESPGHRL